MRMRFIVLMAWIGVVLIPHFSSAHHPLDELYERNRTITLTGTVAAVEWANPHVVITLDVVNGGEAQAWRIEMAPPNSMIRRGYTRDTMAAGARITVIGAPSKTGSPTAVARTIELPGGERIEVTDDSSWNWQRL